MNEDQRYPLGRFGKMAEEHWREFLPDYVAELEERGELARALYEAQENARSAMTSLMKQGYEWGMAWEIVAAEFIHLPPE